MDLVNEYLRAVAALLPKAQREDIIAELRDTILTRIEAREAELGRPLTDDEVEAVLREVGHPVVIAARYREGPQHVVGPTLYPYWLFALKVAIAIQVAVAAVVVIVRTVAFGNFSQALGQAIGSGVTGVLVLVGAATCAAWFIERRGARIDYLDKWRVRDLRMLEMAGWGFSGWRDWFARQTGYPNAAHPAAHATAAHPMAAQPAPPMPPPLWNPALGSAARGVGLMAWGTVLVLLWIGVLPLDLGLDSMASAALDLDPGRLARIDWMGLRAELFWPVLAYAVAILVQAALMIADPYAVRLQGLLETARGSALLAFCIWLWRDSPLASAIGASGSRDLFLRLSTLGDGPPVPLEPIAMIAVLSAGLAACGLIGRGVWNLIAGAPPLLAQARTPPGAESSAM